MASSRNIVSLSDGTGNSSAKLMKTNVWRITRPSTSPPAMLTQDVTEITPRQTGQLFLFVNDAVGLPGFRSYFYDNNEPGEKDPAIVVVKEKVLAPLSASTKD